MKNLNNKFNETRIEEQENKERVERYSIQTKELLDRVSMLESELEEKDLQIAELRRKTNKYDLLFFVKTYL